MTLDQFDDLCLLLVGSARKPAMTCNVRPRYTGGSPAAVDVRTLLKVATEEDDTYRQTLTGVYGETQKALAERDGIGPLPRAKDEFVRRGIAEVTVEHRDHLMVYDILTDEIYQRPFVASMRTIASAAACERCRGARERVAYHADSDWRD